MQENMKNVAAGAASNAVRTEKHISIQSEIIELEKKIKLLQVLLDRVQCQSSPESDVADNPCMSLQDFLNQGPDMLSSLSCRLEDLIHDLESVLF